MNPFYGINQDELRHGEAVALGIKVAAKLSLILNKNDMTEKLYNLTNDLLYKYKLPKEIFRFKYPQSSKPESISEKFN